MKQILESGAMTGLLLAALSTSGLSHAQPTPRQMPADSWQVLKNARGVQFGGTGGAEADVHLVCDAHCPYCARLYPQLRQNFPDVAVRWVPVAYFRPDSQDQAIAILSSPDPLAALDENYRTYDANARRGGYHARPATPGMLDYEHQTLNSHWRQWGGFTPMLLVRDPQGRVFRASENTAASLRSLLRTTSDTTVR